ncbi:MAG: helix-turn-helix domain-containing protein, partial [Chloroflexota bacterium]
RTLSPSEASRLAHLWEEVSRIEDQPDRHNAGLGYLLLSAWRAFLADPVIPSTQTVHPLVIQIIKYLHAPTAADDLKSLADITARSPEFISRLFKRETGIGFAEYRSRCRMRRFIEIYSDGHQTTLLAAALEAGFGSYAQFYRACCAILGLTPRAYHNKIIGHNKP